MPSNTDYWAGIDGGQPVTMDPFLVGSGGNYTDPSWNWGWGGGYSSGWNPFDSGGYVGGGTGTTPTQPVNTITPIDPIPLSSLPDGNDGQTNSVDAAINAAVQRAQAARAIANQPYLTAAELGPIIDQAAQAWVTAQQSGSNPNHGVIDPNQSPNNAGNIGIGIPGLFGVGLGGLVLGGALSGGGGGGGGGSTSQQPSGGAIYPGPYPAGITDTSQGNPTITPAVIPPGGSPNEGGGAGTIVPPPIIPPATSPNEPSGGNTILPAPVPTGGNGPAPAPVTEPRPGTSTAIYPIPVPGGGTTPTTPTTPTQPTTPTTPTVPNTTIANPLDRNLYREGSQTIQDLYKLGSGMAGLYSQFAPQYTQADLANYASTLGTLGSTNSTLTGIANQQTQSANTALRQGNLADAQNIAPQADALRRQLNPELYSNLNALDSAAQQGIQASPYEQGLGTTFNRGISNLGSTLDQSALDQLRLGSSISPEEQRAASQAAREGWSQRGLVNSTGAVAGEVLNRYNLGNQRLQQRENFAQGAYGQQQAAQGQLNSLGLNLAGLDQTRQGQNVSNLATAANLRNATAFDPFNMANTQNVGSNASLFGQGSGFSSGAQSNQNTLKAFDPFAAYPNGVYGDNFNAANARSIAAGNNSAALAGAKDASNGVLVNNFLNLLGSLYGKQ